MTLSIKIFFSKPPKDFFGKCGPSTIKIANPKDNTQ